MALGGARSRPLAARADAYDFHTGQTLALPSGTTGVLVGVEWPVVSWPYGPTGNWNDLFENLAVTVGQS